MDHIVPLSVLASIDGLTEDARREVLAQLPPLIKVYSCRRCNSVLGNRFYRTIADRRDAVKAHLRRQYVSVLNMPHWTEEELCMLGHNLQTFVRNRLALRDQILRCLGWRR